MSRLRNLTESIQEFTTGYVEDEYDPAVADEAATRIRSSQREWESDVIYVDETGFLVDGEQYWVWTFVTDDEVLYMVEESRGSQVLENVLGEEFAKDATLSCEVVRRIQRITGSYSHAGRICYQRLRPLLTGTLRHNSCVKSCLSSTMI
mgnify:FL=1